MKLNIHSIGEYQVITIEEELSVISDLEELHDLVRGYVERDRRKIAVSFPNASYIYSGAIAVLLKCIKAIGADEAEGGLCILEPNPDIKGVLTTLHLDALIRICDTEAELLDQGE
jgi:anti-anti-sigma regulatory factor